MHHLAIMKPSWHFIEKIVAGSKTIESRWYTQRRAPWEKVSARDYIYFKNSGEPVTARAVVRRVEYEADLTPARIKQLLARHGAALGISSKEQPAFYEHIKHKRYGILMWLGEVERVTPFEITKTGFGAMAAWISVEAIDRLRRGRRDSLKSSVQ